MPLQPLAATKTSAFFFLWRLIGGFGSGLLLSMIMDFSPTPQSSFPSRKTTGGIGHGLLLLNLSDSNACWAHAQWVPTHSPRNPPLPFALACACPLLFWGDLRFHLPYCAPGPFPIIPEAAQMYSSSEISTHQNQKIEEERETFKFRHRDSNPGRSGEGRVS